MKARETPGPDVRAELIAKYESLVERHAGRERVPRFDVDGNVAGVYVRPHRRLLERLRAGEPVEVHGWMFPELVRRQLRLHPQVRYLVGADGTVSKVRRPVH